MISLRWKYTVVYAVAFLAVLKSVNGFATAKTQLKQLQSLATFSLTQVHQDAVLTSDHKKSTVMRMASFLAAATVFLSPFNTVSLALDGENAATVEATPNSPAPVMVVETPKSDATVAETPTLESQTPIAIVQKPKFSIAKCSVAPKAPVCVSTSNVRQLDLYSPPWTFASSANEAMARLKGAVEGEPLNSIVSSEDNTSRHLLVDSKRSKLGTTAYRMEFIINELDRVITFRSSAPSHITGPDFGLQRKRLSEIRERAGSFGVMGESLNSADSKTTGERGNGPLGQLKSFYGLQSGAGFEEVLSQ